jgi:hypothetical protein
MGQDSSVTDVWHKSEGAALAAHVVSLGRKLYQQDAPRRGRMRSDLSRYEGYRLTSLDPRGYRDRGLLTIDTLSGRAK